MSVFKKKVVDDLFEEDAPKKGESTGGTVKKLLIPGLIAIAVVVLLVLVIVLKSVLGGGSSLNYYDMMTSIFTNELGSFSYTLMVETGPRGNLIKEGSQGVDFSVSDLQNVENNDSQTTDKDDGEKKWNEIAIQDGESVNQDKEFADWGKYSDKKVDNWKYPVFLLQISGTTMSLDPLVTNFTVNLATPYYNDKFTEVTVRDGNYYFDIESMHDWLASSGDSYLMSLSRDLPKGSKWLTIPVDEFGLPSRYAENGDETELSKVSNLVTIYRRFLVSFQLAMNNVSGSMGTRGITEKTGVVLLNLAGDDAVAMFNSVKNIGLACGNFYDAYVSSSVNSGLFSESQQKQAVREKDNFVEALSNFTTSLQLCDPADMGLRLSGQVREYVNGYNNNQVEGVFGFQFSSPDTDYVIKFTGTRSGNTADIRVPDGSKISGSMDLYLRTFNSVVDYFNFTNIKTESKLSINPGTITDSILDNFVTLVNNSGTASKWITRDNVGEFIAKYGSMSKDSVETEADYKNIVLVEDLISAMTDVIDFEVSVGDNGGQTGDDPVEVEQFPALDWDYQGVALHFSRNDDLSNHKLFVVDCEAVNKTDSDVEFKCGDFAMRTLLGSFSPANNETFIRGYDTTFDVSQLDESVSIPAMGYKTFRMYFVLADDGGHMDLLYNGDSLGALIQY